MGFDSGNFSFDGLESYWTRYSYDDWDAFDIASDIAEWSSKLKFNPVVVLFDPSVNDFSMVVAVCNVMPEPFFGQKSMPYECIMVVKYLAFALN